MDQVEKEQTSIGLNFKDNLNQEGIKLLLKIGQKVANKLARRFPRLREDLKSQANLIVLKAVKSKKEKENENIEGYIAVRVKGGLIDYLYENATIRVPRAAKQKVIIQRIDESIPRKEKDNDVKDVLLFCCKTEEEKLVLKYKIAGYSDEEVGVFLKTHRLKINKIRQIIYERIKNEYRNLERNI